MAKTLYVLRHGKSKRGPEFDTDFERTLAPRGQRDAPVVGRLLRGYTPPPQLILASPAARARETAELVAAELDEPNLQLDEGMYGAYGSELMLTVQQLPDTVEVALLVGHNPGLEGLVDELSNTDDTLLKTCSLAVMHSDVESWREVMPGTCRLVRLVHPKELAAGEEDN
jgi:phosphohistidine phosphatase